MEAVKLVAGALAIVTVLSTIATAFDPAVTALLLVGAAGLVGLTVAGLAHVVGGLMASAGEPVRGDEPGAATGRSIRSGLVALLGGAVLMWWIGDTIDSRGLELMGQGPGSTGLSTDPVAVVDGWTNYDHGEAASRPATITLAHLWLLVDSLLFAMFGYGRVALRRPAIADAAVRVVVGLATPRAAGRLPSATPADDPGGSAISHCSAAGWCSRSC